MTEQPRHTADTITDDALEQLYRHAEQLAAGRATWKAKAEEIERDRDRLAATIDRMKRTNRMVNGGARESRERAEQAEAAIERVRAAADDLADGTEQGFRHALAIRAALDEHQEQ